VIIAYGIYIYPVKRGFCQKKGLERDICETIIWVRYARSLKKGVKVKTESEGCQPESAISTCSEGTKTGR